MKKIDFEITVENLENDAKKLYMIIRPGIRFEEIEYSEFKEGVINLIARLDDPVSRDPLVIRSYNLKQDKMKKPTNDNEYDFDISEFQNRTLELTALERASELGITVNLVATYKNGFIYRFIDGDVNSFELYDEEVAKLTAIKMARLHAIDMNGIASERPAVFKFVESDSKFSVLTKNFDILQMNSKEEIFRKVIPPYSEMEKEYQRLHQIVHENDAYGKICFCHNDLNKTNLLIVKETKEPVFIDFEWCDTNFQMHDISYHLLNMAGSFLQYFNPEHIPNDDFIRKWLKAYYEESNRLAGVSMAEKEFDDLVENELKKVVVNMLLIRLTLLTRAMFFELNPSLNNGINTIKDYCLAVYNDFLKHKDSDLKLLETLRKEKK